MSQDRFTITTKGSKTVVHWEGQRSGPAARPTSTGWFDSESPELRSSKDEGTDRPPKDAKG